MCFTLVNPIKVFNIRVIKYNSSLIKVADSLFILYHLNLRLRIINVEIILHISFLKRNKLVLTIYFKKIQEAIQKGKLNK